MAGFIRSAPIACGTIVSISETALEAGTGSITFITVEIEGTVVTLSSMERVESDGMEAAIRTKIRVHGIAYYTVGISARL